MRYAIAAGVVTASLAIVGCGERKEEKAAREVEKAQNALREMFPGIARVAERAAKQVAWQKRHGISNEDFTALLNNWSDRTHYEGFSADEAFWEVAKKSTPEQLRKRFPPLTDRERYRAKLTKTGFPGWRDFERPSSYGADPEPYRLRILVTLRTPPERPIIRLQGLLKIKGPEDEELHSEMIDHKPDVSFSDWTFYRCEWEYDDTNPEHRTLRYSDKLSVQFEVRHVTFANGETREF